MYEDFLDFVVEKIIFILEKLSVIIVKGNFLLKIWRIYKFINFLNGLVCFWGILFVYCFLNVFIFILFLFKKFFYGSYFYVLFVRLDYFLFYFR